MPDFSPYIRIVIPIAILFSFLLSFLAIPPIVKIAKKHNLLVFPNHRDTHYGGIPRLGGLAIFISVTFSLIFFSSINTVLYFKSILTGMLILFFIGLHDDLNSLRAYKKLIGEAVAIGFVIAGGVIFSNLHGFLGIYEIPMVVGIPITIFILIVIINSFNLIDGIDGLASGLGIQIALVFGLYFYFSGALKFAMLSAILFGALTGFFYHNVLSRKNKIFMGDSGSLILGLLIGLMVWRFNQVAATAILPFPIHAAPAVAMGIMTLPLFDTLRVFTLRIFRNKSPFNADRIHIHHILLDYGLSQGSVRNILLTFNLFMGAIALSLQFFTHSILLIILILLTICLLCQYFLSRYRPANTKEIHELPNPNLPDST